MKTVTIEFLHGDHDEYISRHHTDDHAVAIARAVKKHFGKAASFHPNHELSRGTPDQYGQIGRRAPNGDSYTIDRGRVRISVT